MTGRNLPCRGVNAKLIAAAAAFAIVGFAHADMKFPNVTLQFYGSADGQDPITFNLNQHSSAKAHLGGSLYQFDGDAKATNNSWELEWSLMVSPSAGDGGIAGGGGGLFIHFANLAVTNTTMSNQQFWILATLDVDDPILKPTLSKGDVAVSIQSFIGAGASLMNITSGQFAGDPIYESFIDGNSTGTLMDAPTVVSSVGFGTASATDAFGHPVPVPTPPVTDTISIFLKIEVTPQSIATVIGIYEVIPTPAALSLFVIGGLVGHRRRRN